MSDANTETNGPVHGQLASEPHIIVSIVIGSSIFTIPTIIFIRVAGRGKCSAVWAFGGFLSSSAALCYARARHHLPAYGGDSCT